MDARTIAVAVACAAAGGFVCWAYCLLVRRSLSYLSKGRTQVAKFVGLLLVRFALVGGGFFGALYFGMWPSIGYLVGFFVVRTIVLSRARVESASPGNS